MIKNESITNLHSRLNRHIKLVADYSELPETEFIIKSCRLKPYDLLSNKIGGTVLYKKWFDEYGNIFNIIKKDRVSVSNDVFIDRENIVCSDIYDGLDLDKIIKISRLAYINYGVDEDDNSEWLMLTFYGIDRYLRSYCLHDGLLEKVSPLILGFKNLKNIANNLDIKYYKEFNNEKNIPMPCVGVCSWLSYLPANRMFLEVLKMRLTTNLDFLKGDLKA